MRLLTQVFLVCFGLWDIASCRTETGSGILTSDRRWRFTFRQPFSRPPLVYAWIRGHHMRGLRLDIDKVSNNHFSATFRTPVRILHPKTFAFYYSARENVADRITSVGEVNAESVVLGTPVALFAPKLTRISPDIYDVFGKAVYTSQLYKILDDNANFPLKTSTADSMSLTVNIRCDTFYIDGSPGPFYGIRKMTLKARKIVSEGSPFLFTATQKCSGQFNCGEPPQADVGTDGRGNERAIPGTNLEVYAYEVDGNIQIMLQGSHSTSPQAGGDGAQGGDGANEYFMDCRKNYCGIFVRKKRTGLAGHRGQDGGNGRRGGAVSYPGGSSGSVLFNTKLLNGRVSLTQRPGKAGRPAAHGHGGAGGQGGSGGCGCGCLGSCLWSSTLCIPKFRPVVDCDLRGPDGSAGSHGRDGFEVLDIPSVGAQGSFGTALLRSDVSVREWFVDEDELLSMVQREGEILFQRNANEKAKRIFDFVLSVAKPTSLPYLQASVISRYIEQGFDFYGNSDNYAPDGGWKDLKERTEELMRGGRQLESSLNEVLAATRSDTNAVTTTLGIVRTMLHKRDSELNFEEDDLRSKRTLYLEALEHIELAMEQQARQIESLSSIVLREARNNQRVDDMDLIFALVGAWFGVVDRSALGVYSNVVRIIGMMRARHCALPTIMQLQRSIRTNIQFAFDSRNITENFDYATLDASAVPELMKSDLGRKRGRIVQELHCAFRETTSLNARNMERLLNDFFRDGAARVEVIAKLMSIHSNLKQIKHNQHILEDIRNKTNEQRERRTNNVQMLAKTSMADLLLNFYHHQENLIMKSMYELSKSYQFESLWDYDVLKQFGLVTFSDENVVMNVGSLNGMVEMDRIYRTLQSKRHHFEDRADSYTGPKHYFNAHWKFTQTSHPEVIRQLRATGKATVTLDLDPDDPLSTSRCENCFNGRMIALYIEAVGDRQPRNVPTTTHLMVSHQGDSRFIMPCANGNVGTITVQQTPEGPEAGNVMSFDSSQLLTITDMDDDDSTLEEKFSDKGHKYCDGDAEDFAGIEPCKSPYATYVITVPRSSDYDCPTGLQDARYGTNCRDFDFSRLNEIRMYVKIKSWSNYPTDPSAQVACD